MVEKAYQGSYRIPEDYVEENIPCSDGGEVLVSKPLELKVIPVEEKGKILSISTLDSEAFSDLDTETPKGKILSISTLDSKAFTNLEVEALQK